MCVYTRAHTHTTVQPAQSRGNTTSLHHFYSGAWRPGAQPSRVEPAGQHLRHSMGTCPSLSPYAPQAHERTLGVPFRKYTLYVQSPAREMVPSVRWPWGLKPYCRGGLGTGRWTPHRGRTHTSKQCAADRSHLSATSTAPQRCSLRRNHRLTCQGHSPREAELPPTIRVRAPGGARPQSAESRNPVSSRQRVFSLYTLCDSV